MNYRGAGKIDPIILELLKKVFFKNVKLVKMVFLSAVRLLPDHHVDRRVIECVTLPEGPTNINNTWWSSK